MYLSRLRFHFSSFSLSCALAVLLLAVAALLGGGWGCGTEDAEDTSDASHETDSGMRGVHPDAGHHEAGDQSAAHRDAEQHGAARQDPEPPAPSVEGDLRSPAEAEQAHAEADPADIDPGNVEATMRDVHVAPAGPAAQSAPVAPTHPMAPDRLKGQTRRPTGETVMIDGKYEVPVISAGREIQRSALENAPGYRPPDDPELESVERGRRIVEERDIALAGGMPTAGGLADMILYCLEEDDARCMHDLRVNGVEFENGIWPEFPESRPATHIEAKHAWFYLHKTCWSGVSDMLSEHGGKKLIFKKITVTEGLIRYTNFNMLSGVLIHAEDEFGEEVILKNAHTFCQAGDVWKVYIYKDL